MNSIRSFVETCIKPLFFIKSFNDLILFLKEQFISFRILTGLYTFYPKTPPILYIEPTNHCNINCICCSSAKSSRKKGYMDFNLFKNIVDEATQIGVKKIHLFLHGEPLLHPHIIEMISYIKSKHLSLYLVTNGMLLDKKKGESILQTGVNKDDIFVFSILGYSKEVHEKVMNGVNHEIVVQNIYDFLRLRGKKDKKHPVIKCVLGIVPENLHEKEQFLRFWKHIVDHVDIEVLSESFRYYKTKTPIIKSRKNTCIMLWERMMIFWNGDVTMCCADVDGDYILGNVKDKSISEIWNSQKLLSIKKLHSEKKFNAIPLCSNCDMK